MKFRFALLALLLSLSVEAQVTGGKIISSMTYSTQRMWGSESLSGTFKYEYDPQQRLTALTVLNKKNLDDVTKYSIKYVPNKMTISRVGGMRVMELELDAKGRLSKGTLNTGLPILPLQYDYQMKYSDDGYLIRKSLYLGGQIKSVYQYTYENGNLKGAINTYIHDTKYEHPNYSFEYYPEENKSNFNFVFAFDDNRKNEVLPLYALPDNLIGKGSKNLVKKIILTMRSGTKYTYEFGYEVNADDLVTKMTVFLESTEHTFHYKY